MTTQGSDVYTSTKILEDEDLVNRNIMAYKFPGQEDFTITRNLTKGDKPQGYGYVPTAISTNSAGDFDGLPVEMIHNILRKLDFDSLGSMRLVNSKTQSIVDSLPEYKAMITHAPSIIHTLRVTTTSSHFTAEELYGLLINEHCVVCNDFGLFFFIPLGVRCCYPCLYNDPQFGVMTLAKAKTELGIKQEEFREIFPVIRTVPGCYDWDTRRPLHPRRGLIARHCEQITIVSTEQASQLSTKTSHKFRTTNSEPKLTFRFQTPARSGSFMGEPPYRGMAAVAFPWLNQQRRSLEDGILCQGCRFDYKLSNERPHPPGPEFRAQFLAARRVAERAYTEDGFHAHFEQCAMAKRLWAMSVERTRTGQMVQDNPTALRGLDHITSTYQPAILRT